jgi:ADP-ribose pyrophosphatase YjhB (NUDIX family)
MPSSVPQESPALRPVQRTVVHAVVTDAADRLLLVRAPAGSDPPGQWFLPGGALRHGEHPRDGVLRELARETGLSAVSASPREATADVVALRSQGISLHTLRLIYDVRLPTSYPGADAPALLGVDGTSDRMRFFDRDEAAGMEPPVLADLEPAEVAAARTTGRPTDTTEIAVPFQRPAAYAVLIDDALQETDRRILLTRLSGGTGTWTLPGGGIDHGEHPLIALKRELYEETGLPYTVGPLLDIGSRHFVGRSPNGQLQDFHGLRLIYAGSVPSNVPPRVTEVDGSTDLAAWVRIAELDRIDAAPAVYESIQKWIEHRGQQPR